MFCGNQLTYARFKRANCSLKNPWLRNNRLNIFIPRSGMTFFVRPTSAGQKVRVRLCGSVANS